MTKSTVLQIASNELAQSILDSVVETAEHYEFGVKITEPESFSAPFSGDKYFRRNVELLSAFGSRTYSDFERCLLDIETLVERELSEGYIEPVT